IKVLSDNLNVTIRNDAETTNPKGFSGGLDGKPVEKYLNIGTEKEEKIVGKITAKELSDGDIITIRTAGSGGFGNPEEREENQIILDWKNGYISTEILENVRSEERRVG